MTTRYLATIVFLTFAFLYSHRGESTGTSGAQPSAFAYESSSDLDLKEQSTNTADGVIIRDVDYASYQSRHGRIEATCAVFTYLALLEPNL